MEALDRAWMAWPHSYAERMSEGAWTAYPHLRQISLKIVELIDRGGGTLLVSMPPRHGKSEMISRWTPEWFLMNYPSKRVMLLSYAAEVAEGWSRRARNGYMAHGGDVASDGASVSWWFTAADGYMTAAGMGGQVVGKGAHLLILDDTVKNAEEADSETIREKQRNAFNQDILTRRERGCVLVCLATRWRLDDMYGYIKERMPDAEEITMPAICEDDTDALGRSRGDPLCPALVDQATLEQLREILPPRDWRALFQQQPTAAEGAEILRHWWAWYDELPVPREQLEYVCASWDCTFKDKSTSDWVVGQVWGVYGAYRYLLEQVRARMGFVESAAAIMAMHQKWRPNVSLVELAANGDAIVQSLQSIVPAIVGVSVAGRGSKVARARAVSPAIQAGQVFLPRGVKFSDELVEECAGFPLGKHDDQVDAMSQALKHMAGFMSEPVTHLTKSDNRFVPPHVLELQRRGLLGGLGTAPANLRKL
jgi:predicted phage terminase large subunit-like protein